MRVPEKIRSESQREEFLAEPYPETVEMMRALDGDLLLLGAGGKMGPSLARLALNACRQAGVEKKVIAVSRYTDAAQRTPLENAGVQTIACDLIHPEEVERLPRCRNVLFMAGRKFGSQGSEALTWMMNAVVPGNVARTFRDSNVVAFSTGCVYNLVTPDSGGSVESDPPQAIGEYANSCLGRERIFEYYSERYNAPVLLYRLNYAVDLHYGVLVDIARQVYQEEPVDLTVNAVNFIWQGDANNRALLCLKHTGSPATVLNITGEGIFSVQELALRFGELFGKKVTFRGSDSGKAYLSNARKSFEWFGVPRVSSETLIQWVADWIIQGGSLLDKPTHFSVTDGQFLDEKHSSSEAV